MSSKEKADTAQTVKDSQEPLIGQQEEEVVLSDETISFSTALKESSKLAILQVMGTMFHPIYSIVNNVVLGHANDPVLLAGLGLGALTVGITGLSLGICFAFGAGTVGSLLGFGGNRVGTGHFGIGIVPSSGGNNPAGGSVLELEKSPVCGCAPRQCKYTNDTIPHLQTLEQGGCKCILGSM